MAYYTIMAGIGSLQKNSDDIWHGEKNPNVSTERRNKLENINASTLYM